MMNKIKINYFFGIAASLLFLIIPGMAQDQIYTIEFGYQTVDVSGNENSYLSQENMDDGVFLGSLHYQKTGGMFDHATVTASGFGGRNDGRFMLDLHKAEKFKLHLNYFGLDQFNALPGAGQVPGADGLTFGEYTFDRERHNLDLEMVFRPNAKLSPFVGVRYAQMKGPSVMTYYTGEDEFKLLADVKETETEYYAGLAFNLDHFHGEVVEGIRKVDGSEDRTLADGAGEGQSDGTILGQNIYLDSMTGQADWESSNATTRINLAGTVGEKLTITAAFHLGNMDTDSTESELLSGNLVSFHTQRYYSSSTEFITSKTDNPNWFGRFNLRYQMSPKFSFKVGYQKRSREITGEALVETLYADSIVFGQDHSSDFQDDMAPHTYMKREEDQVQAAFFGKVNSHFRFWIAGSQTNQDVEMNADLSEIVLDFGQEGTFEREITRTKAGFLLKQKKIFQLRAEYEKSDADQAVVRTDFLDRDKWTLRLSTEPCSHFQLVAKAKNIKAENKESPINYSLESDEYAVEAILSFKQFQMSANYGVFDLDSAHTYLVPDAFTYTPSLHTEEGEEMGATVAFQIKSFRFSSNFTRYENTGVYGFTLDQLYADARFQLGKSWSAGVQAFTRDYSEDVQQDLNFDAERYALVIRYSM